jgi:hypothetical protein
VSAHQPFDNSIVPLLTFFDVLALSTMSTLQCQGEKNACQKEFLAPVKCTENPDATKKKPAEVL